jgi:hypothetical protein
MHGKTRQNAAITGAIAVLACTLTSALALADPPRSIRSVNDPRPAIRDELDQPQWRETQSHRGWEIRERQYTVFADTTQADARWAAGHVQQAWTSAEKLADRWTDLHRRPDFGLGSVQIVIDSEPRRERDGPPVTLNVVGIQTQVYLNVAPGQPSLRQQVWRLRTGAALAMLHTVGLDAAVPPWVAHGLAADAAERGLDPREAAAADEVKLAARLGGEQWRYKRSGQDDLDYPAMNNVAAASAIKFLLQGNDGAHAPALLADLRAAWAGAQASAARGGQFSPLPGDAQPPPVDTRFDSLLAGLQSEFKAWQDDPLTGQPIFEPESDLSPELLAAEREMLVVLKLQRKLALPVATVGPRTRVTTFDRNQRQQVVSSTRPATVPASFAQIAQRLSDPQEQPVATLDVDGSVLLSSDTERIRQLLGETGQKYSLASRGDQQVLVCNLAGGNQVYGWLEKNPTNPARPLAKFEIVDSRPRSSSRAGPSR